MFLKEFRKPREYNSYWTNVPAAFIKQIYLVLVVYLNMLLFKNLEKKEQYILLKTHGYLLV
jgi:hypothetical protein